MAVVAILCVSTIPAKAVRLLLGVYKRLDVQSIYRVRISIWKRSQGHPCFDEYIGPWLAS